MIRQVCALNLSLVIGAPSTAEEAVFDFDMHDVPIVVQDVSFEDADGSARSLDDYLGSYVLLNIWATWCAPCREELPSLDTLQRSLGGSTFEVIAISTDTGRRPAVERFFAEVDITDLVAAIDDTGSAMRDLEVYALPTTMLIDRSGEEIGRKIGATEWDSPSAIGFFESLP